MTVEDHQLCNLDRYASITKKIKAARSTEILSPAEESILDLCEELLTAVKELDANTCNARAATAEPWK